MEARLSDQFARKVAQFNAENMKVETDASGFDILSPLINGWVRDEKTMQWICYKSGHAICAVTDEILANMSQEQFMSTTRINNPAIPPLPKGLFGRAD